MSPFRHLVLSVLQRLLDWAQGSIRRLLLVLSWVRQSLGFPQRRDLRRDVDDGGWRSLEYPVSDTSMALYQRPVKDKDAKINFSTPVFLAASFVPPITSSTPLPALAVTPDHDRIFGQRRSFSTISSATFSPTDTIIGDRDSFSMGPRCTSPTEDKKPTKQHSYISIYSVSSSQLHDGPMVANHEGHTGARAVPDPELIPVLPMDTSAYRYWGRDFDVSKENTCTDIEPLTFTFVHEDENPSDWIRHAHPEGQPYFCSEIGKRKYITEANLYKPDILEELHNLRDRMQERILEHHVPEEFQIIINRSSNFPDAYGYYMVNNTPGHRSIFWLDNFDATEALEEVQGMTSRSHLKHYMDYQYWMHWEIYPHCVQLEESMLKELSGILIHGEIDTITSNESAIAYTTGELHTMLSLVKNMQSLLSSESSHDDGSKAYVTVSVGRLMSLFANERYLNFHGQHNARLSSLHSVHGPAERPHTRLIRWASPFLFFAPDVHLRGFEKLFIDERIIEKQWKQAVVTLKDEWTEFILYSTVLLTANVSFLAIPSVDQSNEASFGQITSLLSIIASVGSIILGLLLVRQYRTKAKETAEDAANYLKKVSLPIIGLEPLAIMYSLPYALLMWAMVLFLVALAYTGFLGLSHVQTAIISIAWGVLAVLIAATIYSNWEGDGNRPHPLADIRSFVRKRFFKEYEEEASAELDEPSDEQVKKIRMKKLRERVRRLKRFRPFRSPNVPVEN